DPKLLPHFLELARQHGLVLREHSRVRYFSKFYGQWHGETHLEQISVEKLVEMLRIEIGAGITELSCHPGYVEVDYAGSYSRERELELHTLCDPAVKEALHEQVIELINYQQIAQIQAQALCGSQVDRELC